MNVRNFKKDDVVVCKNTIKGKGKIELIIIKPWSGNSGWFFGYMLEGKFYFEHESKFKDFEIVSVVNIPNKIDTSILDSYVFGTNPSMEFNAFLCLADYVQEFDERLAYVPTEARIQNYNACFKQFGEDIENMLPFKEILHNFNSITEQYASRVKSYIITENRYV